MRSRDKVAKFVGDITTLIKRVPKHVMVDAFRQLWVPCAIAKVIIISPKDTVSSGSFSVRH